LGSGTKIDCADVSEIKKEKCHLQFTNMVNKFKSDVKKIIITDLQTKLIM